MQEIKRPKPPRGTVLFAILDSSRRRRGWMFWPFFPKLPSPGLELDFEYRGQHVISEITKVGFSIRRNLAYVTVEWDGTMPQTYGGEE